MKANRSLFQASLALALAGGLAIQAAPVRAQQGPVLDLDYGGSAHCLFQTTDGVHVSGTNPGVITASGSFVSGCPTGGATPPAAVSLTATPGTVEIGQSATINWSGVGDICRYDGSSLPGPVAGWLSAGTACIGASQCALGNTITPTFTVGGTYLFKLSCTSGASGQQPEITAVETATVEVTGGTPPTSCVAPAGLTRQLLGKISTAAGGSVNDNVDVTDWTRVLGWAYSSDGQHWSWPGLLNNGPKLYVKNHHYWAMEFTVPQDYPLWDGVGSDPFGDFRTNDSDTSGTAWAISISTECGDFMRPPISDPDYWCYADADTGSLGLGWKVTQGLTAPFTCNLERGETYYLNIVAGHMNNPTTSSCPAQGDGVCKYNFTNGGLTQGTYEPIP